MKAVKRQGVQVPAAWAATVERAFADYQAFVTAAQAFEALPLGSAQRRGGFCAYVKAQGIVCFRAGRGGKIGFKALWGVSKEQIAALTSQLCAYCEGEINSPRAGQVEHYKPKSLFPLLAYDWENYLLSCAGCNGAKSDKWPQQGAYLRPDVGDPAAELEFADDGTVKAVRPGDAECTIADLELNRKWLVRLRRRHIQDAVEALTELLKVCDADAAIGKTLIESHLRRLASPETVYATAKSQCAKRRWPRT